MKVIRWIIIVLVLTAIGGIIHLLSTENHDMLYGYIIGIVAESALLIWHHVKTVNDEKRKAAQEELASKEAELARLQEELNQSKQSTNQVIHFEEE